MKLNYCRPEGGNFGDDLNEWLWPELFGRRTFDDDESQLFYGVGTILCHKMPRDSHKIVFGSGTGYKKPPQVDSTFDIKFVRGPLTAQRLKLPVAKAISDAAYLLLETAEGKKLADCQKSSRCSIIPHCASLDHIQWEEISLRSQMKYINPRQHYFQVFQDIAEAEIVLTESLHGAIIADALRVPWKPFRVGHRFNDFKWHDWLQSIAIHECEILTLPTLQMTEISAVESIRNQVKRLAGQVLGAYKWSQRPVKVSSGQEVEQFIKQLSASVNQSEVYLSTDFQLNSVLSRMIEQVDMTRQQFQQEDEIKKSHFQKRAA